MDLASVDHLLTTTRSVRKRLDLTRPVSPEVIEDCLRLAVQAPTGSNAQGWSWVVVTDPEIRAGLADIYRRGSAEYLAAPPRTGTDAQSMRVRDSATYLRDVLHEVPVLVVPCIQGRVEGKPNVAAAGLYGSIFPAVWSFQLALRSRGLGSVLTTLHLNLEQEAAELLGLPDDVTQAALLPVAYYTGEDFKPAARKPLDQVTHWERWQA